MSLQQEMNLKCPFEPLLREAFMNVWRTQGLYGLQVSRQLRPLGITSAQHAILYILWDEGAPLPILEIANRMVSLVSGITGLVDRMEKEGLVARERCTEDRRVIYVTLTKKGQTILSAATKLLEALREKYFGHLAKAELKELIRILEKARERLLAERENEDE